MAVNQVIYGGETLIDLTGDSVSPETLEYGVTAHAANGERITGTGLPGRVRFDVQQTLSDTQKELARNNIGVDIAAIVQSAIAETLKIVAPQKIGFDKGKLYAPATNAYYSATSVSDNSITFQYRGGSGVEEIIYQITGLVAGRAYNIAFDETYNGGFIGDNYRYGCGIMQKSTYDATTFPNSAAAPSYIQWYTGSKGTQSGVINFTAASDTVYWVWNLGRLSDGVTVTISMNARVY